MTALYDSGDEFADDDDGHDNSNVCWEVEVFVSALEFLE